MEQEYAFALTAEESELCLTVLQMEIERIENMVATQDLWDDKRDELEAYIQNLNAMQDEFLLENNSFRSVDMLKLYELVYDERNCMNDILDNELMSLEIRKLGQQHVKTSNSILRKLRKYFKTFEINV